MTLPKELTTVTLVSRIVELIVLVAAMIISFGLGVNYQETIDLLKEQNNLTPATIIKPTTQPINETVYTEVSRSANWKTYTNTKYGYSIKHPPDLIYSSKIDKAFGEGEVNVDQWSSPNGTYTIWVHSYKEGIEPITRIIGYPDPERISEQTTTVAGKTVRRLTHKYQPLFHIGPIKNNSLNYLIVFVASSTTAIESYVEIFDQILSTFRFTE